MKKKGEEKFEKGREGLERNRRMIREEGKKGREKK